MCKLMTMLRFYSFAQSGLLRRLSPNATSQASQLLHTPQAWQNAAGNALIFRCYILCARPDKDQRVQRICSLQQDPQAHSAARCSERLGRTSSLRTHKAPIKPAAQLVCWQAANGSKHADVGRGQRRACMLGESLGNTPDVWTLHAWCAC